MNLCDCSIHIDSGDILKMFQLSNLLHWLYFKVTNSCLAKSLNIAHIWHYCVVTKDNIALWKMESALLFHPMGASDCCQNNIQNGSTIKCVGLNMYLRKSPCVLWRDSSIQKWHCVGFKTDCNIYSKACNLYKGMNLPNILS